MSAQIFDTSELDQEYDFQMRKLNSGGFIVAISRRGYKGFVGTICRSREDARNYIEMMCNYLLK